MPQPKQTKRKIVTIKLPGISFTVKKVGELGNLEFHQAKKESGAILSSYKTPVSSLHERKVTITLCPRLAKAFGRAPATSPSPPIELTTNQLSYKNKTF